MFDSALFKSICFRLQLSKFAQELQHWLGNERAHEAREFLSSTGASTIQFRLRFALTFRCVGGQSTPTVCCVEWRLPRLHNLEFFC